MGCNNASSRQVEMPKHLTINGHIIDNQSRTLMGCCQLSNKTMILNPVEFLGDKSKYLSKNPTGCIPMVEEGQFKVMGGSHVIYYFLCKSKGNIAAKMMPPELEDKIKSVIAWNSATMMVSIQQMFKILYQSKDFQKAPTQD